MEHSQNQIKIAIADDHALFRAGTASLLNDFTDFSVMMQAGNGQELLDQLRSENDSLPDVVLMDIRMPVMDGFETTEVLLKEFPSIKIIVLSMHEEARHIIRMIELGANGYLLKNARPVEVAENIRFVVEDEFYFSSKINALMRKVVRFRGSPIPHDLDMPIDLTTRELEVISLICEELTTNQMAERLFISARTVEGHRKNLIQKLGVKNMAGLVIYALKHELVTV